MQTLCLWTYTWENPEVLPENRCFFNSAVKLNFSNLEQVGKRRVFAKKIWKYISNDSGSVFNCDLIKVLNWKKHFVSFTMSFPNKIVGTRLFVGKNLKQKNKFCFFGILHFRDFFPELYVFREFFSGFFIHIIFFCFLCQN